VALHITNGSSVGDPLATLFPRDTVVSWNDTLHHGPVPPGLPLAQLSEVRAHFLASLGWAPFPQIHAEFQHRDSTLARHAEFDEVILWFEHDLYDQLQLIQILDHFQAHPTARLSLIQSDTYLGPLATPQLAALYPTRVPVTTTQLELAAAAWNAFRQPDPRGLQDFLTPQAALPFLAAALLRYCEEFAWTTDQLTRTQRTIARLRAEGLTHPHDLFRAYCREEEPMWMGDSTFFLILEDKLPPPAGWLWDPTRRRFEPRPS
jgi:hypothetical protein